MTLCVRILSELAIFLGVISVKSILYTAIADKDGCKYQTVQESIYAALKKLKKTFEIDPVLWAFSEETDREVRKLSACFPFSDEWACPLTIKYPFIKHIPIAIVKA